MSRIATRIFNNEVNPHMPTEDVENQIGYFFLFFLPGQNYNEELWKFDSILPNTWQQWSTCIADFNGLLETQIVGKLQDRELVESLLIQKLEQYKSEDFIRDYRLRKNHPQGYY